ncbi:MAG: hypothetical protein AVDCRST_MAG64-425, partial [uncultured Phycisphaerae bacterium]
VRRGTPRPQALVPRQLHRGVRRRVDLGPAHRARHGTAVPLFRPDGRGDVPTDLLL